MVILQSRIKIKNMSKLARIPVILKEGVSVALEKDLFKATGPKGVLEFKIPEGIEVKIQEGKIHVSAKNKDDEGESVLLGLTRAMIASLIEGVSLGFEKKLELKGVGYRAQVSGSDLILALGFSHPVKFSPPKGINFSVKDEIITVAGIDKSLVGNTAAIVRNIRPPEPYKGKGIRYLGEKIRKKAGKAVKALATAK